MRSNARAPDGGTATLHIRCGSDIRTKLQQAGFTGAFLEVSDPLCMGPIPPDGDLLAARAGFLAAAFDMAPADATARLTAEYDALAHAAETAERIVLWFEHDSYDQLLLARILASLGTQRAVPTELICLDHYPGLTRYIGLGQLSSPALRRVWAERTAVGPAQYRLGAAVWDALRDPSPLALHAIAAGGTPEIPAMAAALHRHLQELPWLGDGLSLTQRLSLQTLRNGPRSMAQMFADLELRTEPLPFLGDLMFRAILHDVEASGGVQIARDPELWPKHTVTLTPTGEAVLAAHADWLNVTKTERWIGGVRIAPGRSCWRWDGDRARPAPP